MQIDVKQEARAILDNTEDHASLLDRTAKAIMKSHRIAIGYQGRPLRDDVPAWERHWDSLAPGVRVVYRNQARAALSASQLLERVAELELAGLGALELDALLEAAQFLEDCCRIQAGVFVLGSEDYYANESEILDLATAWTQLVQGS